MCTTILQTVDVKKLDDPVLVFINHKTKILSTKKNILDLIICLLVFTRFYSIIQFAGRSSSVYWFIITMIEQALSQVMFSTLVAVYDVELCISVYF